LPFRAGLRQKKPKRFRDNKESPRIQQDSWALLFFKTSPAINLL
jgi:hypothetical protein